MTVKAFAAEAGIETALIRIRPGARGRAAAAFHDAMPVVEGDEVLGAEAAGGAGVGMGAGVGAGGGSGPATTGLRRPVSRDHRLTSLFGASGFFASTTSRRAGSVGFG